jgi:peptidyl-dipeptidase Dcp
MHLHRRLLKASRLAGADLPLAAAAGAAAMSPDNPFAQPSRLPYQLPPFDHIGDADYRPAFVDGMAAQRIEIDAIARNPEAATFANTIVAMERSGRLLERVETVFFSLNDSNGDDEMLKIETEMAPLLSAHRDAIYLDAALFARIDALYEKRVPLQLDTESLQLLERYYTQFVRAGARLSPGEQARLRDFNTELSALTTQFRQNVLKSSRSAAVVVERESELEGLPAAQIAAAADAARVHGLPGKWLIALQNTTMQPALSQLQDRAVRRRIFQASVARAIGEDSDNTDIIARVVRLRAERARLLGYPNHAAYVLQDETAGNPQAVDSMLQQVAGAGV